MFMMHLPSQARPNSKGSGFVGCDSLCGPGELSTDHTVSIIPKIQLYQNNARNWIGHQKRSHTRSIFRETKGATYDESETMNEKRSRRGASTDA